MSKYDKPNFKLAKFDETDGWDKDTKKIAKKIYGIYLYNENVVTHCCEITPSYEMHFLGSVTEEAPDDDTEREDFLDEIDVADLNTDLISYFHCSTVNALADDCNIAYSDYKPTKDEYEDELAYRELIDDLKSEYRGNPSF